MGLPLRKADKKYTYGDYRTWPEDERWELINGVAWDMSPAPDRRHQGISGQLFKQIIIYLENKTCEIYAAPFDVLLPEFGETEEDDVSSVVQPDILVVCETEKLTDKGCTGAPDWIIEIQSPFTSKKDMDHKFHLYEHHGVREYWIVDPGNRYVHVYALDDKGRYGEEPQVYLEDATISCTVIEGLAIDLNPVFRE